MNYSVFFSRNFLNIFISKLISNTIYIRNAIKNEMPFKIFKLGTKPIINATQVMEARNLIPVIIIKVVTNFAGLSLMVFLIKCKKKYEKIAKKGKYVQAIMGGFTLVRKTKTTDIMYRITVVNDK